MISVSFLIGFLLDEFSLSFDFVALRFKLDELLVDFIGMGKSHDIVVPNRRKLPVIRRVITHFPLPKYCVAPRIPNDAATTHPHE